ncbi:MAG TPA: hypothetical protein VFY99_09560 [Solirubrobacterales bacterium]
MQLVVFTTIGLVAYLVAYSFGLGGTVAGLIFLLILFTGVMMRWAEPIVERLKP